MNVTNSSQALNSSKAPWCPRSIIDDEYIAVDYFFAVLSVVLNVLTCLPDNPTEHAHHNCNQDKAEASNHAQLSTGLLGWNRSCGRTSATSLHRQRYLTHGW